MRETQTIQYAGRRRVRCPFWRSVSQEYAWLLPNAHSRHTWFFPNDHTRLIHFFLLRQTVEELLTKTKLMMNTSGG